MKRIKYILLTSFLLLAATACGTYSGGMNRLTEGMSKSEVNSILGYPERTLVVNYFADGTQEVLEYPISRNEIYAVEFWNGRFVNYERIYLNNNNGPTYIPPSRPSYPANRPGNVNRPNNNRPGNSNNSGRPNNGNNGNSSTGRPNTGGNRPGSGSSEGGRPSTTKPETLPATPSRPSTRDTEVKTREAELPTKQTRTTSGD